MRKNKEGNLKDSLMLAKLRKSSIISPKREATASVSEYNVQLNLFKDQSVIYSDKETCLFLFRKLSCFAFYEEDFRGKLRSAALLQSKLVFIY